MMSKILVKKIIKPGMVVISRHSRGRKILSSRPARATLWDPISKNKNYKALSKGTKASLKGGNNTFMAKKCNRTKLLPFPKVTHRASDITVKTPKLVVVGDGGGAIFWAHSAFYIKEPRIKNSQVIPKRDKDRGFAYRMSRGLQHGVLTWDQIHKPVGQSSEPKQTR